MTSTSRPPTFRPRWSSASSTEFFMCSPMAPCGPDRVVMKPIFTVCADAGAAARATRSPARAARIVVRTIGASCRTSCAILAKGGAGLEDLAAAVLGRDLEAETADLGVDVVLVHPAELGVAPATDAVRDGEIAEARLGLAERVERARIPLVHRVLHLVLACAAQPRVLRAPDDVGDPTRPERGVKLLLVDHRGHLARPGREARVLHRAQVVPGDEIHREAEGDRVDPALERHVEGVDRMLAHAPPHQGVGLGLAFGPERAQQTTVDESLVRLVGCDLRLDVAILRRRPLVDPRMVLLDGGEFSGGDR